jgi:catechol 2,3-dioxygenase-like lactoylglutathione lyase family enzyme
MAVPEPVTHLDLTVHDIPAATDFFRRILALPVRQAIGGDTAVRLAPDLTVHLRQASSRDGGAPARPGRHPGPVIQVLVPEVRGALSELRRRGATVLVEPVLTDWGTEAAYLAGPEDLVIEIYHPHPG